MDQNLNSFLSFIHGLYRLRRFLILLVQIVRGFLMAMVVMGIWAAIKPQAQQEQFLVGIAALLFFWILSLRWEKSKLTKEDVLRSLEVRHPEARKSAFFVKRRRST